MLKWPSDCSLLVFVAQHIAPQPRACDPDCLDIFTFLQKNENSSIFFISKFPNSPLITRLLWDFSKLLSAQHHYMGPLAAWGYESSLWSVEVRQPDNSMGWSCLQTCPSICSFCLLWSFAIDFCSPWFTSFPKIPRRLLLRSVVCSNHTYRPNANM